jgi:hypothetical protein
LITKGDPHALFIKLNAFIPSEWGKDRTHSEDSWPSDAVEMTELELATYWAKEPPSGKRLSSKKGRPVWGDVPVPDR